VKVQILLNSLFKVERGEWRKLLQFGLFGLLLQTGMGVGLSAGDAAFLNHVGPDKLPIIFVLTPVVMLLYTGFFSYLLVRFSIDVVVDLTLALLVAGGIFGAVVLTVGLPPSFEQYFYYGLKLYLAMWYIALYTLFWNFADSFFDIQDAKRLFPLFAACCALGSALGALIVSLFATHIPLAGLLLIWSAVALATVPVAHLLRRRWRRIADSDTDLGETITGVRKQLGLVVEAFRTSRYTLTVVLTLFVTLLMTNLAEFQYATALQAGRSGDELTALFGQLYAACGVFNIFVCLFVFTPLVTRVGVRNVALILPLTYFVAFGYFFLLGGTWAALGVFFAYHGVLTSIEYNNQNLLFNAAPSAVKRPLRTIVEGMGEPLASLLAGGFLLLVAKRADMRELSGIGVVLGAALIAVVMALRFYYPGAMATNMRRGWLNFGDRGVQAPEFDDAATELLTSKTQDEDPGAAVTARALLERRVSRSVGSETPNYEPSEATAAFAAKLGDPRPATRKMALQSLLSVVGPGDIALVAPLIARLPSMDRSSREAILTLLGRIGDVEAIPQILDAAARLSPRELRATVTMLVGMGEAAIPRLIQALGTYEAPYRARSVAARALAALSGAQFMSQLERLVAEELGKTAPRQTVAERFEAEQHRSPALSLLARGVREQISASVDFVLELLALGGALPDFDLLIVSLYSANAKVRGNAIEAIATGVDNATWRRLEPLIYGRTAISTGARGDILPMLETAIAEGQGFEAAAAAQALRDLTPAAELAGRLRPALRPGIAPIVRDSLMTLLALDGRKAATVVDLVGALRVLPAFSAASIEALLALAERAEPKPEPGALELHTGAGPYWLRGNDIDGVAKRYPVLALALLKAQDGRAHAA